MRIGLPKVPDLRVPKQKYSRRVQYFISRFRLNLKPRSACRQFEQGDACRENIRGFRGRESRLHVGRIDQQLRVIRCRRVNVFVRLVVMARRKESSQINKFYPFSSQTNDVIRLEIYKDDPVLVKPRYDRQGFIHRFFEISQPPALLTS